MVVFIATSNHRAVESARPRALAVAAAPIARGAPRTGWRLRRLPRDARRLPAAAAAADRADRHRAAEAPRRAVRGRERGAVRGPDAVGRELAADGPAGGVQLGVELCRDALFSSLVRKRRIPYVTRH